MTEFEQHLVDAGLATSGNFSDQSMWSQAGLAIGALALRLGILSMEEVERIVLAQEEEKGLFGEVAVRLEVLDQHQVDLLLEVQRLQIDISAIQKLVAQGQGKASELLRVLADFWQRA